MNIIENDFFLNGKKNYYNLCLANNYYFRDK